MAAADLDALVEKLRRLTPTELARVKALVDGMPEAGKRPSRFRALSGVLSPEDAESMTRAAEECERIDHGAW